jgi:hypothetical protein
MPATSLEAAYRSALAARNRARDALRDEAALLLGRLALRSEVARLQRDAMIAAEREAAEAQARESFRRVA